MYQGNFPEQMKTLESFFLRLKYCFNTLILSGVYIAVISGCIVYC